MNKHWLIGTVAAAFAIAVLAGGSAYAFSERGQSDEYAAEVALERRADPDDLPAGDNVQEQEQEGDNAVDMPEIIADAFGPSPDDVAALRAQGIGFGAIFKLYAIAEAKGITVDELLASVPVDAATGEHDFAFGQMKKSLSDSEAAALHDGPKNLGQIVSASRRPPHAGNTP
jgi:hypothetical protein